MSNYTLTEKGKNELIQMDNTIKNIKVQNTILVEKVAALEKRLDIHSDCLARMNLVLTALSKLAKNDTGT